MTSSAELQVQYTHLYKQLRKYIWDIEVVQGLAELEIEVYSKFPNLDKAKAKFNVVRSAAYEAAKTDKELDKELKAFSSMLDTCADDTMYAKLRSTV